MAHGEALGHREALPCRAPQPRHGRRARGFAYLWLLFAVAFIGASLAAAGVVWEVRVRRDKEADLLFIGAEFRRAIADYHRLTPQAAKEWPQRLEDLLEDKRGPALRRHLRRLYRDPISGSPEWGIVAAQGRITGVYSLARGTPIRQDGFRIEDRAFEGAARYADWRFIAAVPTPAPPAEQGTTAPAALTPIRGVRPGQIGVPDPAGAAGEAAGATSNTPAMPDATPVETPARGG
jgi:type II secretory pathway pseudopilin PulG